MSYTREEYAAIRKQRRRDENYLRIDEYLALIDEESRNLSEYEYRLFNGGLSEDDITPLEDSMKRLYGIDYALKINIREEIASAPREERFNDLISYQKYLLRCVADIMIRTFNILSELKSTCRPFDMASFIRDNSSLLHLVSTNNSSNQHIRKSSDDDFFYNCVFHNERRSSMRICNNHNRIYCFGCGIKLDIVEYLMMIEGLEKNEAIMLLAEINKIKVEDNPYTKRSELVKKYNNAAALARYERRILSGEERALGKNKTFNNYLALKKFSQEKETIARIRNDEYLVPSKKDNKKKLLYVIN